ncbi:hypothetical protein NKH77_01860 [Streptomyces sp. M19]
MLGMFAVHVFGPLHSDGSPTLAWQVAAGRAAATFAVCAGWAWRSPAADGGRSPAAASRCPSPSAPCSSA